MAHGPRVLCSFARALKRTHLRGHDLAALDIPGYDPDGYYIERQHFAMIWPDDDHGRMIGEHAYENKANQRILKCALEDFLTVQDAPDRLLPLLRPLPVSDPSMRAV